MNDPTPDVRTRLLNAAFMLLTEKGVAELTQPKVAKAAGVRTSHLTYYFPTRNDLLIAAARYAIDVLIAGLKEALARTPGKISGLAQVFGDAVATQRMCRLMLGLIVASEEDRTIKSTLNDLIENERAHLRNVTASAGVSIPEDMIPICHATLVGAAVLNLARDTPQSEAEARRTARFVVDEILGRSGRAASQRTVPKKERTRASSSRAGSKIRPK